jgi:hypothetical protein
LGSFFYNCYSRLQRLYRLGSLITFSCNRSSGRHYDRRRRLGFWCILAQCGSQLVSYVTSYNYIINSERPALSLIGMLQLLQCLPVSSIPKLTFCSALPQLLKRASGLIGLPRKGIRATTLKSKYSIAGNNWNTFSGYRFTKFSNIHAKVFKNHVL